MSRKNEYLPLEIFIAFRPMGHYRRTFRVGKKHMKINKNIRENP